jgi:predicted nucleotidyltransferase
MGTRAIRELRSKLRKSLAGRSDVLVAYLYGSQAEGRASTLSDIDIGVLIRDGLAKERLWQLEEAIAADLRRVLHTDKVDLVVLNLAPLRLRYEVIIRGEVLYSADDEARAAFESYSLRRYWDFAKYLAEYDRYFITRIKEGLDETQHRQYQDSLAKVRAVHHRVKEAAGSQL